MLNIPQEHHNRYRINQNEIPSERQIAQVLLVYNTLVCVRGRNSLKKLTNHGLRLE